jgi:HPt (histidine-containing phosphotransfer) domain-containing protein
MSEETLIDLNHLEKISGGNKDFIREILQIFLEQTPREIAKLREYLEHDEMEKVEYYAHKLKSATDSIGFSEGRQLFNQIEDCARLGKPDMIAPLVQNVSEVCSVACQQVSKKLEKGL